MRNETKYMNKEVDDLSDEGRDEYFKIIYRLSPLFCLLLATLAVLVMAVLDLSLFYFLLELQFC